MTSDRHAARFDGTRWSRIDLPTNASLTSICSVGADRYAIAGKEGTLVIGSGSQWRLIPPLAMNRSYWGVGSDGKSLYVASLGGIDQLINGALQPLKFPTEPKLEFNTLSSGQVGVWSFAGRTIGVIRGGVWTTIMR